MTRTSLVAFLSCILGVVAAGNRALAQTQQDKTWWHGLSDGSRNFLILQQALREEGTYGGECKAWVRNLVYKYSVSRAVVWLPANDPVYSWRWQWSPNVQALYSDRWDGVPLYPGQIIQAVVRTRSGATLPHTMIVGSANWYSITVIESNWNGNGMVWRRTASWPDFQRNVVHYTLYQVK